LEQGMVDLMPTVIFISYHDMALYTVVQFEQRKYSLLALEIV
jgi:hypothetical protein